MKKFTSAFAVCFALAIVYAALTSRVVLLMFTAANGNGAAVIDAFLIVVANCVLALLVGIFAGFRPFVRCWAVFPAPIVLPVTYLLVAGTVPALYYLCALCMLGFSVLGIEIVSIVRIARKLYTKA